MSTPAPARDRLVPRVLDRVSTRVGARVDRFRPWTRRVLLVNLVAQIGIVATGGLVRLTSSGLGCVTWPQCQPGSFVPVAHGPAPFHQGVEFGNRLLTFVVGAAALAVLLLVGTDRTRTRPYRRLGAAPLLGVVVQAVVGGVSVLLHLAPWVVGLHFLISMVLVVASAWLLVRHDEGDAPPVPLVDSTTRRLLAALGVVTAVVLALGVVVTGAGPHSGDDELGYRFAVDPYLTARVHAASVWVFVALLVAVLLRLRRDGAARPLRTGLVLMAVTLAQALVGYVQLFTGLPIALVNLHMIGAALLTAGVTRLVGACRSRGSLGAGAGSPVVDDPALLTR
ncbi:COX15/CtaA family protein [Cellulomonas marina]|uniref:Cytochrome c oxidase assembly protein subunit 15 n=1 Tax=Cellulomonas marina TaxID=988821 RepID=A0A1I0ZWI6_9CELL|nr:COX15/CtaA family protein [Cellulomonas marina]GIG28784.1 heme A synthase [Cellulomonas marina]SFB28688.1 cytochrome c oxidase assembly protein subunit 15 [Cellulomonas marina]